MLRTKILPFILVVLASLVSCIKEYDPVIVAEDAKKLVVSGSILDNQQVQIINISRTAQIEAPEYIPVLNCQVSAIDNSGNSFIFTDMANGNYACHIEPSYLTPGTKWKVQIITPESETIVSDDEEMTSNSGVDSVYYEREDIESNIPGDFTKGIRFLVDVNNSVSDSRYYKWELTETWEYHADYPVIWWYDGEVHMKWPPDSSMMFCWNTQKVPYIYTLTTEQLSDNKFKKLPLHFVDNISPRLVHLYSLLTVQYSLTRSAYIYWDQLKTNSQEQGGLYDKQPLAIKGNLHNITNPDEEVLGYFFASSVKEKRIFVSNVPGLELEFTTLCNLQVLRKGLRELVPSDYPAYLYGDEKGWVPVLLDKLCVECTGAGGVTVKPDYWPN
ncbi:MAG TPA: DUF4249 domain-containing protein [Lentimicrobium sp.]|nr:DUF4249 domain-containing protein [Lentimicrobium sp.]